MAIASVVRRVVLVGALVGMLSPGAVAAAEPGIRWRPCQEDAAVECATVPVPVDWADPGGARIDVAVTRLRAEDPAARIGSLVVNPGGPGGSGVDFVLGRRDYFSAEVRRRFDIVGFDPRGVGRSHPVVCSAGLLAREPELIPSGQADVDRMVSYNARLRADCRRQTGPLYDHVDTLSVVRDLDALRAALGDTGLTFYGGSYGTLIGQQYAELFPDRVRALVLDSNVDHSLGTRALLTAGAVSLQDSFTEFAAWCDRTPSCVLHGRDIRTLWAGLLARAARGELPNPYDPRVTATPTDIVELIWDGTHGPEWDLLAQFLLALDTGSPTPPLPVPPPPPDTGLLPSPTRAIYCADFHLPVRDYKAIAEHLRHAARQAPDVGYAPASVRVLMRCLGTPTPIANPQHRLHVTDLPTPLLLVNARHDPDTGYGLARNVANQLGDEAVLLTYDGWGHGVYGRTPCTTGAVDHYLITRTPPALHCPAEMR